MTTSTRNSVVNDGNATTVMSMLNVAVVVVVFWGLMLPIRRVDGVNFLTDGTISPNVTTTTTTTTTTTELVTSIDTTTFTDCDTWFGIKTRGDCLAACGNFLLNFNLFTRNWVQDVDGDDGDNDDDDDDDVDGGGESSTLDFENLQRFDTNTRTDGLRKLYAGFICQCPNQQPSINCVYTYSFPSCRTVGVVDCSDIDLSVSTAADPPRPPISVTIAPAVAPDPPFRPPVEDVLPGPDDNDSLLNNTSSNTTFFPNATERDRYLWRGERAKWRRNLQEVDGEPENFLDEMFNSTTEGPPVPTNPSLGDDSRDDNNATMGSGDDMTNITTDVANTTTTSADSTTTTNNNNNQTNATIGPPVPISCAAFCASLGMDVGANSADQTSKSNINNKATRTICVQNSGTTGGDRNGNAEEFTSDGIVPDTTATQPLTTPWVACACHVRSVLSNDGTNRIFVNEGFYVCGDDGFNMTKNVIGDSGGVPTMGHSEWLLFVIVLLSSTTAYIILGL